MQFVNKLVKNKIHWLPKLIIIWILYCININKIKNKNTKKEPMCLMIILTVNAFIVRPININKIVIPLKYIKEL